MNLVNVVRDHLGLVEEEEFTIAERNTIEILYRFKGGNLQYLTDTAVGWQISETQNTLGKLVRGEYTIVCKPWEPQINMCYFYMSSDGFVVTARRCDDEGDHIIKNNVGVFKSPKECFDDAIKKGRSMRLIEKEGQQEE